MATQEQIASFIARRVTVGRVQPGINLYWYYRFWAPPYSGPLPAAQQIANDFVAHTEFQALQLGGLFNTATGQLIEQAVEMVIPRALAPEFDLIVAGLKLAADLQRGQKWSKAILSVGGTVLAGMIIKEISKAA